MVVLNHEQLDRKRVINRTVIVRVVLSLKIVSYFVYSLNSMVV